LVRRSGGEPGWTPWAAERLPGLVADGLVGRRAELALIRSFLEGVAADAYQHAVAISPPGLFAAQVPMAIYVFMDLVEAAVRTNRPWALRAGNELRASGLTSTRIDGPGPASLTPQEREIAEFAAAGLTNKQIAERLFMSHRTVGAHLYRVFPKLGVTSRAAFRDALAARPTEPLNESRS
jgi:DNA-binding CsgD family transcriptional regulator